MAGPNFYRGQYEFQCLHGMGEPLYEEVVGRDKLDRPCRVYAPVGSHETLLAYLVRRLLENGANSSFVNRIADASVTDRRARRRSGHAGAGDPPARRAARQDRAAARPLRAGAGELARARLFQRAAPRRARGTTEGSRPGSPARLSARRDAGREGRARAQSRRSFRHRRTYAPRARRRDRRRDRGRVTRGAGLGRCAAERARGDPAPRRRPARSADRRPRRPDRARGRQVLRQRGRRSARGGRLPALLRFGSGADAEPRLARSARRWSPASARGTFPWRSSPARSRRRSPPATR